VEFLEPSLLVYDHRNTGKFTRGERAVRGMGVQGNWEESHVFGQVLCGPENLLYPRGN
jgi:hypothetical protein